ncbi:MAG: hypothetical protein IT374_11890 [Polyangiaceae bacterium]|nr:hypothetical protein [Polyangiaceae bacterium]
MRARAAWVLNLDAEDELRLGAAYAPRAAASERARELSAALTTLTGEDAVVVERGAPPPREARGLPGHAWCPTPSALAALAAAGAIVGPTPPVHVLRAVNHRRFHHAQGAPLAGARWLEDADEILSTVARGRWLLKRAFGFAGRGRLACGDGVDAGAFVARALREDGGVAVEPRVEVTLDVSLHGVIEPGGAWSLGRPVASQVRSGAWQRALDAEPALSLDERAALFAEGERVAVALHAAGYFGPFAVDGFRHEDGFCARCEINARFGMAFGVGWGRYPRAGR